MVIDSSALIALLLGEVETPRFLAVIAASPRRLVSAASYVEAAIVIVRRSRAREELDQLLADLEVELVQFNRSQAILAITAYMKYGKGRGHATRLNFGDCLTYACKRVGRAGSIQRQ